MFFGWVLCLLKTMDLNSLLGTFRVVFGRFLTANNAVAVCLMVLWWHLATADVWWCLAAASNHKKPEKQNESK